MKAYKFHEFTLEIDIVCSPLECLSNFHIFTGESTLFDSRPGKIDARNLIVSWKGFIKDGPSPYVAFGGQSKFEGPWGEIFFDNL